MRNTKKETRAPLVLVHVSTRFGTRVPEYEYEYSSQTSTRTTRLCASTRLRRVLTQR